MNEERGPWFLLTGLLIGLVLGIVYAWLVSPVQYVDNPPSALRDDFKDHYRTLIAVAFTAGRDLGRAQARLNLLGDPDPERSLAAQAQRLLSQGGPPDEARALGELAAALRQAAAVGQTGGSTTAPQETSGPASPPTTGTPAAPSETPTEVPTAGALSTPTRTPRPSRTPTPTGTPRPTVTTTSTPGLPFELENLEEVCDPPLAEPLIQVLTLDAEGNPVPGVEIVVTWQDGEERFFTGLKPELGLGYGDFTMTPGVSYTVRIDDGGEPVPDLTAPGCSPAANDWGSWQLIFAQPGATP